MPDGSVLINGKFAGERLRRRAQMYLSLDDILWVHRQAGSNM